MKSKQFTKLFCLFLVCVFCVVELGYGHAQAFFALPDNLSVKPSAEGMAGSAAAMAQKNTNHFSLDEALAFLSEMDILQFRQTAPLSRELVREILNYPIEKIMVVGDGIHPLPIILALLGKQVTFLDLDDVKVVLLREFLIKVNEKLIENGREIVEIEFIESDITDLDFEKWDLEENSFDLVTIIDFAGGLLWPHPKLWLQTTKKLLKKNAYIIFDEGNYILFDWRREYPESTLQYGLERETENSVFTDFENLFPDHRLLSNGKYFEGRDPLRQFNRFYRVYDLDGLIKTILRSDTELRQEVNIEELKKLIKFLLEAEPQEIQDDPYKNLDGYVGYFLHLLGFLQIYIRDNSDPTEYHEITMLTELDGIQFEQTLPDWLDHQISEKSHKRQSTTKAFAWQLLKRNLSPKERAEDFTKLKEDFEILRTIAEQGRDTLRKILLPGNIQEGDPVPYTVVGLFLLQKAFVDAVGASDKFFVFRAVLEIMEDALRKIELHNQAIIDQQMVRNKTHQENTTTNALILSPSLHTLTLKAA